MAKSHIRITDQKGTQQRGSRPPSAQGTRERLLVDLPVTERRLKLNGLSTAVLEGGDGPPVVLLHGPGEYAAKWLRAIPDLVTTHRVIVPDLPGHGTSGVIDRPLDVECILAWLDDLIECTDPPMEQPEAFVGALRVALDAAEAGRSAKTVERRTPC